MVTIDTHRHALARAAGRQARQARRTAGRMLVSAVGFGVAYYFDTENGSARRRRLGQTVRQVVHDSRAGQRAEPEAPADGTFADAAGPQGADAPSPRGASRSGALSAARLAQKSWPGR